MAAIPVTITGVMVYSGLEVGGGPMPGGPPLSIWGGAPLPVPTPPIYYPPPVGIWPSPGHPAHPIAPGGPPPGIWGGGNVPMPTPPIYYPPVFPAHPIVPPGESSGEEPPGGGWVWSPIYGWVWQPVGSGGKPKPPSTEGEGEPK
jgi:hypothetical protein